jgi:hypothetical protein
MFTLIAYAGGALAAVAIIFVIIANVLPRGEQIAPPVRDEPVWDLPSERTLRPQEIAGIRLPVALRGYRFAETDQLLDRLADELHERDLEIARLRGGPWSGPAPSSGYSFAADPSPYEPLRSDEHASPYEPSNPCGPAPSGPVPVEAADPYPASNPYAPPSPYTAPPRTESISPYQPPSPYASHQLDRPSARPTTPPVNSPSPRPDQFDESERSDPHDPSDPSDPDG